MRLRQQQLGVVRGPGSGSRLLYDAGLKEDEDVLEFQLSQHTTPPHQEGGGQVGEEIRELGGAVVQLGDVTVEEPYHAGGGDFSREWPVTK